MAEATRQDRIKFAKEKVKKGVTEPKQLQWLGRETGHSPNPCPTR